MIRESLLIGVLFFSAVAHAETYQAFIHHYENGQWQKQELRQQQPTEAQDQEDRLTLQDMKVIGQLVWDIVKAGEPQLNFESERISVVPKDVESPFELSFWNIPQSEVFKISYENKWGMEVISMTYRLVFTSGGRYQGRGLYLTNVAIEPMLVDVSWGFNLNAKFEALQVINLGSQEDPIAGLELKLTWETDTPMQKTKNQVNFFVDGQGRWQQM